MILCDVCESLSLSFSLWAANERLMDRRKSASSTTTDNKSPSAQMGAGARKPLRGGYVDWGWDDGLVPTETDREVRVRVNSLGLIANTQRGHYGESAL